MQKTQRVDVALRPGARAPVQSVHPVGAMSRQKRADGLPSSDDVPSGEPGNEAARRGERAKSVPGHLAAAASMLDAVSESERANWALGDTVTLRGMSEPTQLAILA